MGGMTGALIFKYSTALEMMTSSLVPVMARTAGSLRKNTNNITNTHHTKYMPSAVVTPFMMRLRRPAPRFWLL